MPFYGRQMTQDESDDRDDLNAAKEAELSGAMGRLTAHVDGTASLSEAEVDAARACSRAGARVLRCTHTHTHIYTCTYLHTYVYEYIRVSAT